MNTHVAYLRLLQSKKMTKLLAALDLVQVGTIKIVEQPEPGGEFPPHSRGAPMCKDEILTCLLAYLPT